MKSLSEKRAERVINKLLAYGINCERIKTMILLDRRPLIKPEIIIQEKSIIEKEKFECKNRRITYKVISWEFK